MALVPRLKYRDLCVDFIGFFHFPVLHDSENFTVYAFCPNNRDVEIIQS